MTKFSFPADWTARGARFAPEEAIAFLEAKGIATGGWSHLDIFQEEQAGGFTIAGVLRQDLLGDVQTSLSKALSDGQTFDQWRAGMRQVLSVRRERPDGSIEDWTRPVTVRDPKSGNLKEVDLTSIRRQRVIYDTNIRTASAAGEWAQIEEAAELLPFLRYSAVLDDRTRPEHRAWHGVILPVGDPFWKTHFPPCGYLCRCLTEQLSRGQVERAGGPSQRPVLKPVEKVNPRTGKSYTSYPGVDDGFAYNPGVARLGPITAQNIPSATFQEARNPGGSPGALAGFPEPRALPASALLPKLSASASASELTASIKAFLDAVGGEALPLPEGATLRPRRITDRLGQTLIVGEDTFVKRGTGASKLLRDPDRSAYLELIARALVDPDEIWLKWVRATSSERRPILRLMRHHLAVFQIEGQERPVFVSLEATRDGFQAVTGFDTRRSYLDERRAGYLAFRRGE